MVTVRAPSSSATSPRKIAPYRPVRIPIDRNRSPKGAKASSPKPMLIGIDTTAATKPPVRSPRRLLVQLPRKTANAEPPARGVDCSARGSSDRSLASTTCFCPIALRNARDVHPDLVDARARGDVQGLVVGVAELDVGDELGREDRAQMLALGRDDPHPARRRFPDVALDVDLQAVGDSGGRIAADVDEHPAVGHRVVGQDAIAPHVLVAAAVRVQNSFVGRQGEAVRVGDVVDDPAHASALDHVDALEVQAPARVLLAKAQAAVGVGEVDRAVLLDDDVVRAVELLPFEAVGEDGALAVLLDPVDRPPGPGRDDEPALPVEGEPVRADHVELLEQGIARVLPVGLLEAHAPDVGPGVAAAVHVDGRLALGRELVDHVCGDVAQEQVAALLDPDDALGNPKPPFTSCSLASGDTSASSAGSNLTTAGLSACDCALAPQAPRVATNRNAAEIEEFFMRPPITSPEFFRSPQCTGPPSGRPRRPFPAHSRWRGANRASLPSPNEVVVWAN